MAAKLSLTFKMWILDRILKYSTKLKNWAEQTKLMLSGPKEPTVADIWAATFPSWGTYPSKTKRPLNIEEQEKAAATRHELVVDTVELWPTTETIKNAVELIQQRLPSTTVEPEEVETPFIESELVKDSYIVTKYSQSDNAVKQDMEPPLVANPKVRKTFNTNVFTTDEPRLKKTRRSVPKVEDTVNQAPPPVVDKPKRKYKKRVKKTKSTTAKE